MDTISRENNSMLPVGAIIVGVIALLLGGYSAITLSKVNRAITDQQAKIDKIERLETQATSAAESADKAAKDVAALQRSTQTAFDSVGPLLGSLQASVTKLEDSAKKAAVAPVAKKGGGGAAPLAGDEYIVKAGETGMRIAAAKGVPFSALQAVNPGVNWNRLAAGQKIKLPKR